METTTTNNKAFKTDKNSNLKIEPSYNNFSLAFFSTSCISVVTSRNFTFTGRLRIHVTTDLGKKYETYGSLSIDFGTNLGVEFWRVEQKKPLYITLETSYYVDLEYTFQESSTFVATGNIVFYGAVFEKSKNIGETVGDYEGETIPVQSIFDNNLTKRYSESGRGFVEITMKVSLDNIGK